MIPSVEKLRAKLPPLAWRRHLLSTAVIISLTATGAFLPGIVLKPGVDGYISTASLEAVASNGNPEEVARAVTRAREAALSPMGLSLAVAELNLKLDDIGGQTQQGHIAIWLDLLLGAGGYPPRLVDTADSALQKAVEISQSSPAGVNVSATAQTPETSQRIVDYFANRLSREIDGGGQEPGLRVLEQARATLDAAEAALTGFQMRYGNEAVSHIQLLQQQIREADAKSVSLERQATELESAVPAASSMKRDDVLGKSLPALPAFAALDDVRQNYASATVALAEISIDHGPKHPRTIAAQGAVDTARSAAMPALRKVLEALNRERSALAVSMEANAATRADLEKQLGAMGDAPAELARLETALEKSRRDYLIASEKVGPFSRTPYVSATLSINSKPGTALHDGFAFGAMVASGAAIGFLLSLFLLSFRRQERELESDGAVVETLENDERSEDLNVVEDQFETEIVVIEPGIFDDIDETSAEEQAIELPPIQNEAVQNEVVYEEAANDVPLDQRVREVLMRNAVPAENVTRETPVFTLPPLLAAALAGKAHHADAETEELKALRQELVVLKERLSEHAAREEDNRSRA